LPFELFSIMQMPKFVPPWDTLMDDLGHPAPDLVARALGVGRSTVYRWNSAGHAPRVAALAVFWLTRWGRSEIDARATNDALMGLSLARSLAEELSLLRASMAVQPRRPGDGLPPANRIERRARAALKSSKEFCVVGTKTSPPRTCARVAPSMPPKNPRKG